MRKGKFLVAGVILVLAMGFLGYRGVASSLTYYLTVSEFKQKAASLAPTERVKVDGNVVAASVTTTIDGQGQLLKFTIVDREKETVTLLVVYRGVVPDTFKPDSEVVVEGIYTAGVFQADKIMTKCASKYLPNS